MSRLRAHLLIVLGTAAALVAAAQPDERRWLAGDTHLHSHWSPGYNRAKSPPEPMVGQDARYATALNAEMARRFGLSWMVTTDHGGPNHAKLNATRAYAELMDSRRIVPEVLQFYGMELNMPAMDHHTVIVPHTDDEWLMLYDIESQFDANQVWPVNPERRTERAALAALEHMNALPRLPLLFANHPSRSAKGIRQYGLDEPRELRLRNDLAPDIYRGMEGAPGHQAGGLAPDGSQKRDSAGQPAGVRGGYNNQGAQTLGGFDQMTAIVGGVWDSLLGEGRRFWIVASSDSHAHYTESPRAGSDFWPGQFHKTYVHARATYDDVLDGLRAGRMFVVAGDLIAALDFAATSGGRSAEAGGTLKIASSERVEITIRFRDPDSPNHRGDTPEVSRVDLIVGDVRGPAADRTADTNETARVVERFWRDRWSRSGDVYSIKTMLPVLGRGVYVRVRGTSSQDLEPQMDERGESPWSDLWFYSNPIFIDVDSRTTASGQR